MTSVASAASPAIEPHGNVALVGAGAVARSLGLALAGSGFRVTSVISAHRTGAARLALVLGARHSGKSLDELPAGVDALFICVPDDVIEVVSAELASLPYDWNGRFVAHTAGGLNASVLESLERSGALVASFHPLQSFPRSGPPKGFSGSLIGIEGGPAALEVAERIAVLLKARSIRIPSELKSRYHLAASIASNFVATLMATVTEVYPDGQIFLPLVRETLDNIEASTADEALTGPIARGDVGTLKMHLEVIRGTHAHLLPVYVAMATETVRVAVRGRHLAPGVAEQLLDLLADSIAPE